METQGYIDFYGFHPGAAGWFFCGWLPLNNQDSREIEVRNVEFSAVFESGRAATKALLVLFDRADLGDRGTGFVMFVNHFHRSQGRVGLAELRIETRLYRLGAADTITQLRDIELVGRLKAILPGVFAGHHTEMTAMLERRGFTGADTVHSLTEPIRMGLDEAIVCRPDGIVLLGWCIDVRNAIASLSLSVGGAMCLAVCAIAVSGTAAADPISPQCWQCLQRLAMELPAVNPQEDASYEQGLTPGSVLPALANCSLDDAEIPTLQQIIKVFTDAQVAGGGATYVQEHLASLPKVSAEDRAKLVDGATKDLDTTLRHLVDHNCRILLQSHFDEGASRKWVLQMIEIGQKSRETY